MKFTLTIKLGNEGMQTSDDIAHALRDAADRIERDSLGSAPVRDRNGNLVGRWRTTEK